MTYIVTREDVVTILQQWQEGRLNAEQVHAWAEERAGNAEVGDWEGAEPESVTNEVLSSLDMLDLNLMLPADIPSYLDFLHTPPGQFATGYQAWQAALGQIDYAARKATLQAIPFYARFCQ